VPLIHKYTFDCVIKPLVEKNKLSLKFLKWFPPDKKEESKEEGDDDDVDLDSSDA